MSNVRFKIYKVKNACESLSVAKTLRVLNFEWKKK